MGIDAAITLAILSLLLGLLTFTRVAPDLIFMGCLTLLLVTGVVTASEAFSGFTNEGILTVGVLYIVVAGLRETGSVYWLSQRLLGHPNILWRAQLRLMAPVTIMSAFLNNTPVVAMLIPVIRDWATKHGIAPSKVMIPLSYAAILGGSCTLIGTSTNLVVNGLLLERNQQGFRLFEIAWVGLPTAILGFAFILLTSRWLLPDRRSAFSRLDNPREYSVEMVVVPDGPLVGKSIEEAGLRHLGSVYLIEIDRNNHILPVVSPEEVLQASDRLVFVGVVDSIVDLQRIPGLLPATNQVFKLGGSRSNRMLIEAVVSDSFPLIGKTIREGRFRSSYEAVVIAVARNGERIEQKIGDIVLRPGDTLLLEARSTFLERQRNSRDFYLVSQIQDAHPLRFERSLISLGILIAMVTAVTAGWLSMLNASLLAAGAMILTRCCPTRVARRSIDWSVLVVIASAFGIGQALEATGLAHAVSTRLTALAGPSPGLSLAIIYIVTALFSSVITNNATAVLMFPIAAAVTKDLGVSILPFAIAIMMAASASFATPVGYQTNLMVYGPGGYRFRDYLRIGLPLNLLTATLAVLIIPLIWSF